MYCVVIFGACFCIYGLMSIISGKSMSPDRIFTKRMYNQENLVEAKARIAGSIYLVIGIGIILIALLYFK
jgi:hypothetical protein